MSDQSYRSRCEVCEEVWEHGTPGTDFGARELHQGAPREVLADGRHRYPVCPGCESAIRGAADRAYSEIRKARGLK